MSQPEMITRVTTSYGTADTFWDVYFKQVHMTFIQSEVSFRSISVEIDPESGEVTLNRGYERGSPENEAEEALINEFLPSIVEALMKDVPANNPDYRAFLAEAQKDTESRHEQLRNLAHMLFEHEIDLEERANDADHLSSGTLNRIEAGIAKFNR